MARIFMLIYYFRVLHQYLKRKWIGVVFARFQLLWIAIFVKNILGGVPVVAQWLTNPTRNHEVAGLVPALVHWVKDPALP